MGRVHTMVTNFIRAHRPEIGGTYFLVRKFDSGCGCSAPALHF
jgi:hypothetical protein